MIINFLFRVLLTFNATSLLAIIFFVQKKYTLYYFFQEFEFSHWLSLLPKMASYVFYMLIPILLTWVSLLLSSKLGKDEFREGEVVALSITSWSTLFFVYGVLFIFTFMSQALYFNPLFLLFRYEFYNIKNKSGASIFLISRHKYKTPNEIKIPIAFRINNYTFIERKKR